jgi:hypothetical protein
MITVNLQDHIISSAQIHIAEARRIVYLGAARSTISVQLISLLDFLVFE